MLHLIKLGFLTDVQCAASNLSINVNFFFIILYNFIIGLKNKNIILSFKQFLISFYIFFKWQVVFNKCVKHCMF